MERETGFEPATNSLEGCDSTPELLPLASEDGGTPGGLSSPVTIPSDECLVEAGGFEPP